MTSIEKLFTWVWQGCNGPKLESEFRFHPTRKWRFDFAHPKSKVAIELEGGVWRGGAHTRGVGFIEDCTKYNSATAMGWRVFRLATGMVGTREIEEIIVTINETKAR